MAMAPFARRRYAPGEMSDKNKRAKPTVSYPADVGKAMQLLSKPEAVDPEAVVAAFAQVREEAADSEVAQVIAWLRARDCPTPASWDGLLRALADGEHRAAKDD
jgi:hypothetical protein